MPRLFFPGSGNLYGRASGLMTLKNSLGNLRFFQID
jgi:hypothetical protein